MLKLKLKCSIIYNYSKTKPLGRHLTQHIQDLNSEDDKMLMIENQRRSKVKRHAVFMDCKTIPIVKMTILLN